jgi:secondary thiamine-phosphate synthase enzyme
MRRTSVRIGLTSQEPSADNGAPAVFAGELEISTKGELDMVDISGELEKLIDDSGMMDGIVNIFVPGATGALTTMEYEPGVVEDLRAAIRRMAPDEIEYQHHLKWKDGNGQSHVRAALIGPSVTVPLREGHIPAGTWQQVVFIELDVRPRKRKLLVQIVGTR